MLLSLFLSLLSLASHTLAITAGNAPSQSQISDELGPQLSPNAQIVFPDSPTFGSLVERAQSGHAPSFRVVVVVATENDVAESVRRRVYLPAISVGLC